MSGRIASAVRPTYRFTVALLPSRDEIPILLNLRELLGRGVEVGVQRGLYSETLLQTWRGVELISVDPWLADKPESYVDESNVPQDEQELNFTATTERLAKFGHRSVIWRTTSVDAAASIQDATLDFVYLDARHDYASVTEDLAAWFPKLRPAGILAGHDYYDGVFDHGVYGVKSAVDLFAANHRLTVFSTYQDRWPSWVTVIEPAGQRRLRRRVELGARSTLLLLRSAWRRRAPAEDVSRS